MSTEDLFDDAELEGLSPSRRKMILRKRAKQGGTTAAPSADDFDDAELDSSMLAAMRSAGLESMLDENENNENLQASIEQ